MASSSAFRDRMVGLLLPFGPVRARSMFGGFGLYLDGIMFALIAYDTLYFKVDGANRGDFVAAGMSAFSYEGRHRPIELSYYEVPPALLRDPPSLAEWAARAHEAAKRAKRKQPAKKKRS